MENKEEEKGFKGLCKKIVNYIVDHSVYLLFISVIVWVGLYFNMKFNVNFNNSTLGVIGDSVGGFFGPLIGFFSALLVYKSFQEQKEANKLLRDSFVEQKLANENSFQEQKRANNLLSEQVGTEHGFMLLNKIEEIMANIENADEVFFSPILIPNSSANMLFEAGQKYIIEPSVYIEDIHKEICKKYHPNLLEQQIVNYQKIELYNNWRTEYLKTIKELNLMVRMVMGNARYKVVHSLLNERIKNYLRLLNIPYIETGNLISDLKMQNNTNQEAVSMEIERNRIYRDEFKKQKDGIVKVISNTIDND